MDELREPRAITRRQLLAGTGAFIVSFSLLGMARGQETPPAAVMPAPAPASPSALPGDLNIDPMLDSWIAIDADNQVTVFTGKAELGQGVKTAILQCAAEELKIDPLTIKLITADTVLSPNEGYTAGSMSMSMSGTAVRNAAAQVRELLIAKAATQLKADPTTLTAQGGQIVGGPQSLTYGALVTGETLHVNAQPTSKLTPTADFTVMGTSLPRVDIPGIVTGAVTYVQDLRPDGMLHGRVVRPPSYTATLADADTASIEKMPGVVKVIRDGSYLAVIAQQEWQAIVAMRTLARSAKWKEQASLPDEAHLPEALKALAVEDGTVADSNTTPTGVVQTFDASYTRPYQMHGSIGPSCALGQLGSDGVTTIYTHTQGVYPDHAAIAQMLGVDQTKVHCIHMQGSGCYGHNQADDAAADAALMARAVPGKPVRVQFMREQEHAWEPYGPGMVTHFTGGVDANGKIAQWDYELWSNSHNSRPGPPGALLSARYLATPFPQDPQVFSITPTGSGDRNSDPLGYSLPQKHVIWHFIKDQPLRQSALRSLGAFFNLFSMESSVDEMARLAGVDPVDFRLTQAADPRGAEVIRRAASSFDWAGWTPVPGRGRGFAFARYENHASYLAIAVEIAVNTDTGTVRLVRANAAIDSGEIVNPNGIRNQTEGGILQSMSWTLYEAVTFDRTRITSIDWQTYPILRFGGVPDSIEVDIVPQPGQPFLGAGEAAQGPTSAAIANAIRDAIGVRLYDLPLTADKVKAALLSVPAVD
ncbi:MAG: xanthine dehydrogenase family protein molybdopterin-binding subunit [Devosia sp.]|uniref:xanthine dehydrogenase family protein molybdopterin-binding subunit n=1 Tax=Devosia sp. TaxID=1871048 RepID=UPI0026393D7A|nr:molybdopterin cofactor-binding domain-containing protein [Devosia sp.]MDB5541108.1 xanthine dehydrogenase family protein molybdopterin-binding subunit [Devosia sp.]